MKNNYLYFLSILTTALIISVAGYSATYTVSATGNWNAAATWTNANTNRTGTITASTANTTVNGVGTAFLSELSVGSVIATQSGLAIGTVSAITSNTQLTLTANSSNNVASALSYRTTDGPGGTIDDVVINNGFTLTVNVNASCNTVTYTAGGTATGVTVSNGITFNVTGDILINAPTAGVNFTLTATGTINAGSVTMGSPAADANDCVIAIASTGILDIAGNLVMPSTFARNHVDITTTGTIRVGGNIGNAATPTTGGGGFTAPPSNSTLTLDGAGAQTVYLAGNGGSSTFGVVNVTNTGGTVTCASALNTAGAFTLSSGANFAMGANLLTLQGNFVTTGATTSGSGGVTITGGNTQSIGGFTNTGTISLTKTGTSTATFTGNVSGGALTINNAAGATLNLGTGLTHTISGAWTRTAGILNGGSSTLQIAGSISGTGGTFTPSTGTIEWNGAAQTIGGLTYYNLTISNSGTKTAAAAIIVTNNLTLGNGSTFAMSTFLLTLQGNLTNNGGTTSGSGGVTISGTATQSIGSFTTTGTVSMTKTGGTATFTGNVSGAGLTINGTGGTLNLGTGLTHTFSGTWTRTNGTLNGGSSTLQIAGSISGTGGTFTPSTGTIEWNGAAQTIGGLTYYNLTISNSGTKTAAAAIIVTNNLTLGNGSTFAMSTFLLTLQGNLTNNGGTTSGSGGVTISGTATQSIGSFTTTGTVSMTKTGGTATFTGNVSGAGLTINGTGGTLNLGTSLTHTFSGAWTRTAGTLDGGSSILQIAGSVSGTGSTFTASTGTVEWNGAAQTIALITYYNLTLSGSNTKTGGAGLGVTNFLTVNNGVTFDMVNNSISVGALSGAGTVTHSTGTAGARTLTIGSANINSTFSGSITNGTATSASIIKTGTGTLTLSGASSSYTGTTTISNGVLQLGGAGSGANGPLGTTGGNTSVNGGTLDLNGFTLVTTEPLTLNGGTGYNNLGALTNSSASAATYSGLITLGGSATVEASNGNISLTNASVALSTFTLTLDGTATGCTMSSASTATTGGITKEGTGTWTLSGNSQYTGATTINNGVLKLGAAGSGLNTPLGTIGTGTTVNSPGTLDLNGFTLVTAEAVTINGSGTSSAGSLANTGAAASYSGAITLGSSATINATGNITLSGAVTAAATRVLTLSGSSTNSNLNGVINNGGSTTAGLIKSGSGTWTIANNTNQYSGGTTISGGTLSVTSLTTTTNLGTGGITMDGGTLQYNGSTQSTALSFVFNSSTSSTINVNSAATTLTLSSAITGGGSLVKSGAGTLTFGNTVGLAGITVSAGTLNPGSSTIIVSGNFDASGGSISSPVTATLNFNGSGTQTFTPGSGITYNNVQINNTSNPVTLAGATTINALTVNTNTTFSDGGFQITGGSGTLTVNGTLKLGGTNATTFPTFTSTTLGSGSTVEYASNNVSAQAIAALSYANLVSSGTGPRTLPSGIVNISGSFTPGSNVYTNTGNTINFNGTTAQSVPSFDYYNSLTVSGSRGTNSVTFGSDVKLQGDFNATASFTSGGYITTGSTFTFNGNSYQYVNNSFAFNSVTVNSSAAVVLNADASIGSSGVLTLTSGQLSLNDYTLTILGNTITTTGGSLDCSGQVIGSGGTLKCSQSGSLNLTYSVVSGGINNLTVDQGGTLSLREEISSNIFDVGGVLNVTNNSRVELYEGANLQITGTVSMGSGSPTGYIKANSADQVNTKARMRIAGGNRNVGTLYFDQGIDRSSNAISEFVVATSVSGASVTLGNKLNITNLFTPLTDSKSFTLNSGGNLTMRSSSVWTSSVGQVGSNFVFSGDVVTERWVNAKSVRRYVFIGVPTNGVTIRNAWQDSTFITAVGGSGGQICGSTSGNGGPTDRYNDSGYDATTANLYTVFRFNGSAWVGVGTAADTTRLWSGYGYRILYRGPRFTNGSSNCTALLNTGGSGIAADSTSLTAKGSLTTGSLTVPINSKPGAASYGYTVLANPYHCQIDFNTFHANNVGSSGINRGFWIHDPNGASTTGYVTTFNNGSGWQIVGRDIGSPSFNTNTTYLPYIAPGQGFFVSTANATNNLTVTFQETHKVVPTAQQNGAFRSTDSNPNENDKIRTVLLKADSSYIDDMLVLFSNDAGVTKSTFDAKYDIISLNSGSFVAGIKGGRSCGIQTRPISFYNDTVSLRVTSASTGNFVLRFMEYELFDSAASIILLDGYTGTEWDVKADPYYSFTITSNAATQGVNRFKLVFRSQLSVLPVSFLSVSAMKKPEGAEVKWRVAFEQKIDRYEVERSDDGRVFRSIGSVISQGDSYVPVDYSYTDRNTITGTVYYRVKSVEQGGGIKYSSIVKLNSSKETLMSVYPNPVKDELRVQISGQSTDARPVVVIRNLQGKTVKQQQLGGSTGNYGIDVKELPAGLYVIQVELSGGQRLTEKFVKQ